jgi:hypothetical protein
MKTLYISVDIESDGPCPGKHSLLQLGSAAFDGKSEIPLSTYTVNLALLPTASQDPSTMKFWEQHQAVYSETRMNTQSAEIAMPQYVAWLKSLDAKVIFVGYPASFDSLFVFWYLHMFAGENPFGWQALDLKTLGMALINRPYAQSYKGNYPKSWFGDAPHTHRAIDDAIEQGVLFTRMMAQTSIKL